MSYIEKLLQGAEVDWKPLGEVATLEKGKQLNKSLLTESGSYPAYNGGITYSGFTDRYNYSENKTIISQGGASAGFVNFITTKFYANAHCYVVLPNISRVDNKYVYHLLKMNQENLMSKQLGAGIPALHTTNILGISIPIPCPDNPTKSLEIQRKIVEILDKFTTLEAELEAELDCRKRQYEYYRNQLLSFDMLNRGGQRLNNVMWLKMGDIAEIYGGLTGKSKVDFGIGDAYFIPYKNIFNHSAVKLDKLEKVSVDTGEIQHNVKYGDVLFTGSSETPEEVGMSSSVTTEPQSNVYLNSFCFGVRFKEGIELMPEFSKFLFRSPVMRHQIYKTANGVTRFNISKERFKKILIPIPPLFEQQRIISILDKFDTLTNSISKGLPKEIELRRKQYEYYRNEILSFPKHRVIA